jgi:hypothetical protein
VDSLDIENATGYLNVEIVTDGGILIFCKPNDNMHLQLDSGETMKLTKWLVARINHVGKQKS